MSALSIQVPFPVFQDRDGQPLDNGYVWLGTSSLNPQTNPVVAYYDSALTIVATQPLRTLNGFISRAGSPAQVYVDAVNFSILVQDSKGTTVFSVPEGTGISPNASGVVYDPAGTGAVATTVAKRFDNEGELQASIFFTDAQLADITARTLTLDVTTPVMAAIVSAKLVGSKRLIWPAGAFKITSALNCTNYGSAAQVWVGQGFDTDMSSGTTFVCRTAADATLNPGWCADFTGSQNITLEEMNFWGAGANASTKGLLFARTASHQYVQQINLRKVCVKIATSPAATAVGSIAIANNQAEQFKTDHCAFYADTPMVAMLNNNLTLVSPYATIDSSIQSTTALQFSATTFYAYTQSAMTLWGVASANWDNSCIFAKDGANVTQYAIDLRAGGVAYNYPHNLDIKGQVEGFVGAVTFSSAGMSAYNVKTELFMVALGAAAVVTAASVVLYNCEFDNNHPQNISGNVNLSCGTGNVLYGGKIVTYPNDTGVAGSPTIYGTEIAQDASGRGLKAITAGTDMTGLGTPDNPQTNITNDGYVQLSGILQAGAVVASGNTIGTIDAVHRPNRTVYGTAFVSGIGTTYVSITSGGLISLGTGLVNLSQVSLDTIVFKRVN